MLSAHDEPDTRLLPKLQYPTYYYIRVSAEFRAMLGSTHLREYVSIDNSPYFWKISQFNLHSAAHLQMRLFKDCWLYSQSGRWSDHRRLWQLLYLWCQGKTRLSKNGEVSECTRWMSTFKDDRAAYMFFSRQLCWGSIPCPRCCCSSHR